MIDIAQLVISINRNPRGLSPFITEYGRAAVFSDCLQELFAYLPVAAVYAAFIVFLLYAAGRLGMRFIKGVRSGSKIGGLGRTPRLGVFYKEIRRCKKCGKNFNIDSDNCIIDKQ